MVSPDIGGAKRVEEFRQALSLCLKQEISKAFLEKYRIDGKVGGEAVVGDINGKVAIIVDDLISTGGTLVRAAHACRQHGAFRVYAAASHGLFTGDAVRTLTDSSMEQLVITKSALSPRFETDAMFAKLTVLDAAPLFAAAIH